VLSDLQTHQQGARQQDDALATYASKVQKQEAEIDWQQDALTLDRRIRAFNPFPVCFSTLGGERVKLWQAQPVAGAAADQGPAGTIVSADRDGIAVRCGSGGLNILKLQLPGGKPLSAQQVLNARREQFAPGQQFETTLRDKP
jgi:methionyl-tRNA formyltransferase